MSQFASNSVAFVTGAGSGLGKAVAVQFVRDGIHKIALVDLSEAGLSETINVLKSIQPDVEVLSLVANCSRQDDIEAAVETSVQSFGRLDVCCNAAGIAGVTSLTTELTPEQCRDVVELNMMGVWFCERAQIRQMLKQDLREVTTGLPFKTRGSIVNIGSNVSVRGMSSHSPYVMAKHAVLGLTRTDAIDYGGEGIRVNCICPGFHRTNIVDDATWESRLPDLLPKIPLNRLGAPEEVGFLASFLASDRSSFITGQSLLIDGGLTLR